MLIVAQTFSSSFLTPTFPAPKDGASNEEIDEVGAGFYKRELYVEAFEPISCKYGWGQESEPHVKADLRPALGVGGMRGHHNPCECVRRCNERHYRHKVGLNSQGLDAFYKLGPDSMAHEGVPHGKFVGPLTLPCKVTRASKLLLAICWRICWL